MICAESHFVAPITSAVGDHFVVNVTSALPIQVPGSATQNSLFVDAFDTGATLGPGAPGGILGSYQMTPTGFVAAAGQPPPLVGPFTQDRNHDYIGFVGYCCGYGVPDSGFSMTGVTADLTVITADPRPIIGYSVGYTYDLASPPSSYADLVGGTAASPLILPSGLIGKITGEIGGAGPSTQFYNFNWYDTSPFQTRASVFGAAFGDTFAFELFNPDGSLNTSLTLNNDNGFSQLLSAILAPGNYTIGLAADALIDPTFTLTFLTPVGRVPEPATWGVMLLGFAGVGATLRRRRGVGPRIPERVS